MRHESPSAPQDLLIELLHNPSNLQTLPSEVIPALRGELARLDTMLLNRLLFDGRASAELQAREDRLLDAKEGADRLSTSEDWLYRHAPRLPFTVRLGKKQLRFSESGIEKFITLRAGR